MISNEPQCGSGYRETSTNCDGPKRETISSDVVNRLRKIAAMAEELSNEVGDRLHPVMSQDPPQGVSDEKQIDPAYPPLFSEINSLSGIIEFNLGKIDKFLRRLEV